MKNQHYSQKAPLPAIISLLFIVYLFFFLTPFAESEGLFQMGHKAYPSFTYKVASILPSILYYIYTVYIFIHLFSSNKTLYRPILFPSCIIACVYSMILLCGQIAGFILMFLFFPTIFCAIASFFVGIVLEKEYTQKQNQKK